MIEQNNFSLTAVSSIDGRYHDKSADLSQYFSEYALIKYRVFVECAWLNHISQLPEFLSLNPHELQLVERLMKDFTLNDASRVKEIEKITNHDVKAVEYFISEQIQTEKLKSLVHFACTSEDINNLAYALALNEYRSRTFNDNVNLLIDTLRKLAIETAENPMLSFTHGQIASPTTMGKEIAVIINRLNSQILQINQVEILGKINGAVGNFNAHIAAYPELDWPKISEQFIEKLGLKSNPYTTQIEPHDWIAEYCHGMIRINNILQDFCVDVWLYISKGYFKSKAISTETGSSTMPHKVNPIDFENAEGNLGLSVALLDYLSIKLTKSRLQRDLTDSTTLRNLGIAFGYQIIALKSLLKGISKLELNEELMLEELNQEPSVLAEAIQTVMRKHGIADAYEQLKAFTRGKVITLENIIELIDQVDIPEADKVRLKALKPEDYIGLAKDLAKNI